MPSTPTEKPADDPLPRPVLHRVTFQRNVETGMWRSFCTCGWLMVGAEHEVKIRASGHDLEWAPVP